MFLTETIFHIGTIDKARAQDDEVEPGKSELWFREVRRGITL